MTDTALGCLGVDLDQTYTSAGELPIEQGTEVVTRNGKAILVRAASGIAANNMVVYGPSSAQASASTDAFPASTTNLGGRALGIAQTSIASGSYGWIHTEGVREMKVLASAGTLPNVPLYTTGTAGVVDDATVTAGYLQGLYLLQTASTGATSAVQCILKHGVTDTHAS